MNDKDTSNEIAIKVEHIGKTFEPQSSARTLKEGFIGLGRKLTGKKKLTHHKGEYTALKDISFEVKKGEFFGIVGKNGCGKSTLLKILAGVYTPTSGHVQINGKLTPFIELGVGFNPELSGRDNVFLNGALLGFSRKQMQDMYDDIVDFAELHNFMDTKLKNYSSGMQVRLAFSVAIRAQSDILLIDEVLAVGDAEFQNKCFNYFSQLKKSKKTVILVSHDMESVRRFCDRALLINKGKVEAMGNANEVTKKYNELNELKNYIHTDDKSQENKYTKAVIDTKMVNKDGKTITEINPKDNLIIELNIDIKNSLEDPVIGVTIEKSNGETVFASTTEYPNEELPRRIKKGTKIKMQYKIENIFGEDIYTIDTALVSKDRAQTYYRQDCAIDFRVQNWGNKGWLLHPKNSIIIERKEG